MISSEILSKYSVASEIELNTLSEIKKLSESKTVEREKYIKLVKDLHKLLGEIFWIDKVGGTKWIESIEVLSPEGKFPIKGFNPELNISVEGVLKGNDRMVKDFSKKAYLISIVNDGVDSESFEKRRVMKNIFEYFFSPKWEVLKSTALNDEIVESIFNSRIISQTNKDQVELTFFRLYEGNHYWLKLRLNTLKGGEERISNSLSSWLKNWEKSLLSKKSTYSIN